MRFECWALYFEKLTSLEALGMANVASFTLDLIAWTSLPYIPGPGGIILVLLNVRRPLSFLGTENSLAFFVND